MAQDGGRHTTVWWTDATHLLQLQFHASTERNRTLCRMHDDMTVSSDSIDVSLSDSADIRLMRDD